MKLEKRYSGSILVRVVKEGLLNGFEKNTVNKCIKFSNNM